jgi:CelD/BcsL family acetyltransferase involved in cellulose biosynthesis
MQLHARLFTSLDDLAPHAARWNELVRLSPGNTIFLTWEWLSAWNTFVARGLPLFIIVLFDQQDQLQAILPLYQSSFLFLKHIPYKCLRPMGDCHCGSEYPDIITAPNIIEDVLPYFEECLQANRDKWDCLYLRYAAGWTDGASRLSRLWPKKHVFFRQHEAIFSSISLPGNMEIFNREQIGSLYPLIRRQKKKLEQSGTLSISLCQQEQELPFYLDNLFRLHKKRWESVGQQGSFIRRPLMQDFYSGFSSIALNRGWLKLFALRVDDTVLAVQIGYLYNGIFYQLQEGFDPGGPGGLGNVLRHAVIEWCIANKVAEYDNLGGGEEHKLKWGAKQRTGCHLFCGSKSIKNILLTLAEIWPSGRFITEGPPTCYGHSND